VGDEAPNEVASADGGWRILFEFLPHWPAAAELLRSPENRS
jgi:hypothetical protein